VVKAIHGDWDTALHVHSRATPIDSVPEPPAGPKEAGAPVTEASHRVPLGLVTEVVAECPHAAEHTRIPIAVP
jgi:hypothetical protein